MAAQQGDRFSYAEQNGIKRPTSGPLRVEEMCRVLPDGRIACIGVGPINCMPDQIQKQRRNRRVMTGEITCLAFQKVDFGVVNALLPTDQFIPIDWEDRPSNEPPDEPPGPEDPLRIQNLHRMIPLGQGVQGLPAVPPHWQTFTDIMAAAKEAILARMPKHVDDPQNPGNVQHLTCETLLEAYQDGIWNTPQKTAILKANQIKEDIRGKFPNLDPAILKWIKGVCDDFTSIGPVALESLLDFLFPNILFDGVARGQCVISSPLNTSINVPVAGGCAHCLVYGYHGMQEDPPRGRARNQTPVEYRVALRKAEHGHRSRSRSRSPVRDTAYGVPIHQDMESIHGNVPSRARDRTVIDSPGEYIVYKGQHHHYFESYRPDLMVVETQLVQDLDPGPTQMREAAKVKLVCELSATRKFCQSNLTEYLQKITEECVQCCLSSLGFNQDLILGLVVIVDGFKLIKIEKQQGNHLSYRISESDLIVWNNPDAMHEMFHIISNIM